MSQIMPPNQLDDSNGSIQVTHNNAMQSASQTTESPASAKKTPPPKRFGLLAILAIGVDAAASFLKSKMEKAAAVASQVGAAVLKSQKAVFSAAAALLVRIRPEPPKKTRLASVPLFALLAVFFAAQNQGMAVPRGIWLPKYEEHNKWRNVVLVSARIPIGGLPVGPVVTPLPQTLIWGDNWSFWSEYYTPGSYYIVGRAKETRYIGGYARARKTTHTTYLTKKGNKVSVISSVNAQGQRNTRITRYGSHLDLVFHTKVGERKNPKTRTATFASGYIEEKSTEKWENKVFFHKTYRMDGGSFEFSVHFGARNEFIPSDDLNCSGYCEAGRISAYPGPATSVSPCVPVCRAT